MTRDEIRALYHNTWEKRETRSLLSPLEKQILAVILQHPEYHTVLSDPQKVYEDFSLGITNPFFHMGLHLAIQEQCQTDRPAGISAIYQSLVIRYGSDHAAEHAMMDCLSNTLAEAEKRKLLPDEMQYLLALRAL